MECRGILIIEDDQPIREALKTMLEMEGYETFTAANGQEGVEKLQSIQHPCLILLDLMMPVMNGWQFVEAVGNVVLATIPVVVITAFSDTAGTINARSIIKKPIDIDVLLKTVREYCGPPGSSK